MAEKESSDDVENAMAVNSMDDATRMHADPDETEVVTDAFGDLRPVDDDDAQE